MCECDSIVQISSIHDLHNSIYQFALYGEREGLREEECQDKRVRSGITVSMRFLTRCLSLRHVVYRARTRLLINPRRFRRCSVTWRFPITRLFTRPHTERERERERGRERERDKDTASNQGFSPSLSNARPSALMLPRNQPLDRDRDCLRWLIDRLLKPTAYQVMSIMLPAPFVIRRIDHTKYQFLNLFNTSVLNRNF